MALQAEFKRVAEILNSMKVMGDFIITHGLFIKYVSNSFSKKYMLATPVQVASAEFVFKVEVDKNIYDLLYVTKETEWEVEDVFLTNKILLGLHFKKMLQATKMFGTALHIGQLNINICRTFD